MAGNQHPWRDVIPNKAWFKVLQETGSQQHQDVNPITNELSQYHSICKTDAGRFDQRIKALQNLSQLATDYLNKKHGQSGYQKPQNQHKVSESTKRSLKGLVTTIKINDTNIDRWVYSLGRRAVKKADYLEVLKKSNLKYLTNVSQFKSFLIKTAQQNNSPELLRIDPGTKPEKWDPCHRPIEVQFNSNQQPKSGQHSDISAAFIKWYNNTSNLPFFVWLEGEPICTQEGYLESARPEVRSVLYGNSDGIRQVNVDKQSLVAKPWMGTSQQPTKLTTDKGTLKFGEAFVWLTTGELLIHKHVVGSFHHSSFNCGRKVRCAGMMTVKDGKVTHVDNNSGHYKPTNQHFLTFLKILDNKNVLDDKALIATHDINKGKMGSNLEGYSLNEFKKEVQNKGIGTPFPEVPLMNSFYA